MPIVYKQHLDTRDGRIYNCVLMPDGKWWSAENLRWAGAGVAYNNDPAMEALYGRLYNWSEANANCPSGTHLPSDGEWTALETAITNPDGTKLKANSPLWKTNIGTDDYGFAVLPGGQRTASPSFTFAFVGSEAYFRTATGFDATRSYKRSFAEGSPAISGGVQDKTINSSVRFIVDVFNEPIPPTKIHGTFSGSGVKVFASRPSDSTFEVPLSAQSTTELTISKDFIATWGAAIGRVRILVVDGEHISEWKDWDFRI